MNPALPLLLQYPVDVNVRVSSPYQEDRDSVWLDGEEANQFHRWTPLMWATYPPGLRFGFDYKPIPVVTMLLRAQANPQLGSCDGTTPLTLAVARADQDDLVRRMGMVAPSPEENRALIELLCMQYGATGPPIMPPDCAILQRNVETEAHRLVRQEWRRKYLVPNIVRRFWILWDWSPNLAHWVLRARERCWAPPGSWVQLRGEWIHYEEGGPCYNTSFPKPGPLLGPLLTHGVNKGTLRV